MKNNWRKSSYSSAQGNCAEVANHGNRVLVRDTKDRTGSMLRFTPGAWIKFAKQVKADASLAPDLSLSLRGELLSFFGGGSLCYATSKVFRMAARPNNLLGHQMPTDLHFLPWVLSLTRAWQ